MAIRIREIEGHAVALCAAKTKKQKGDFYIDDTQHYALATKFAVDWNEKWFDSMIAKLMKREEKNNR